MNGLPSPNHSDPHARWKFLRDFLVFEVKLALGNLQNFLLLPISIGAGLIDLFVKREREGELFYKVVEFGRTTDEAINLYGAIGGYHATGGEHEHAMKSDFTVDAVVNRLESVIVREYEKGGTAANIKAAVDKALDQMQQNAGRGVDKVKDAVKGAFAEGEKK